MHRTQQTLRLSTAVVFRWSLPLKIIKGNPALVGLRWYTGGLLRLQIAKRNPVVPGLCWYTRGSLPLGITNGNPVMVGVC